MSYYVKLLCVIIFISSKTVSIGQTFQLNYKGEKLNLIDSNGLKQGKWIEFPRNDTNSLNFMEGTYLDNIKTGKWQIHSWNYDYEGVLVIYYYTNGWFKVCDCYRPHNLCFFSEDSSIIYIPYVNEQKKKKLVAIKDGIDNYQVFIYNKMGQIIKKETVNTFEKLQFIIAYLKFGE